MDGTTEMTFPGFVDVHVHFRDPGAPEAETTASGLAAARRGGFPGAANGIVGLETAIPLTWTAMVEEEGMDPEAWARAWWKMPRSILSARASKRLESAPGTRIAVGEWRVVDVAGFASRSRNCPFDGWESRCWPVSAART